MAARRPQLANVDRLHEKMRAAGLDAVVARSGQNFTYLSGVDYPGTLARHQDLVESRRASLVVWPLEGEPVLLVDRISRARAGRDTSIARIEEFDGFGGDPFGPLVALLVELGLSDSSVGIERNTIGALDWNRLSRAAPAVTWHDCTALMDEVRWVKTQGEVDLIRRAADLLDDVYARVLLSIRPGDSERDVHARLVGECIAAGAGWVHGILNNATRNPAIYCGEGDTRFEPGDVVRTDYVAYLSGYPGHQNRNVVVGEPGADQREEYARHREIYLGLMERLRPGARASELYEHVVAAAAERGFTYWPGLCGHSVGAWWHQQEPTLCRGCEVALEPGMVIAIEPLIGDWHVQDMILVRESGPELLSTRFDTSQLMGTA